MGLCALGKVSMGFCPHHRKGIIPKRMRRTLGSCVHKQLKTQLRLLDFTFTGLDLCAWSSFMHLLSNSYQKFDLNLSVNAVKIVSWVYYTNTATVEITHTGFSLKRQRGAWHHALSDLRPISAMLPARQLQAHVILPALNIIKCLARACHYTWCNIKSSSFVERLLTKLRNELKQRRPALYFKLFCYRWGSEQSEKWTN